VLECTNVLQTSCRRGRISSERRAEVARELHELPIQVDHDLPGFPALDALAAATGLSAYDAAYLELAVRKQLPMASQDAALTRAARTSGLKVLTALAA
jgi:predicted nucleic acid-binding protein